MKTVRYAARRSRMIHNALRDKLVTGIVAPCLYAKELRRILPAELLARNPPNIEGILEHEFKILGRVLEFEEIDWEADFNGGSWPKLRASQYSSFYADDFSTPAYRAHGDIKRAWELNKHLHFVDLAISFFHTRDHRLDDELCMQLKDWIEKHPYPMGIGWSEPLIVAHRAISWIIAYNLGCLSKETKRLSSALFIHGYDLTNRLETSPTGWNSNHLIGELAALYLIGDSTGAEGWRRLALNMLRRELDKQAPDEAHYEQSSSYHRYVLEFIFLVWLANQRGPKWLTDKISRMMGYLRTIALADGTLPLLSDQDGARIWVRDPYRPVELFDLVPSESPPASRGFHDSGYYVMRYDDHVLVFDCGPIGMKGRQLSTHGHSDLLSFVLSVFGRPFIVDIGSGTYTEDKELHDYFRSTAGHNTVTVDGRDQCGLSRTWTMKKHPRHWLIEWRSSDREDTVSGGHDGFHPLIHERRIVLKKLKEPLVEVTDRISGNGCHEVKARMHLHPEVEVRSVSGTCLELRNENRLLNVEVNGGSSSPSLTIREGLYSPDYGRIQRTRTVELLVEAECPIVFLTQLRGKRTA